MGAPAVEQESAARQTVRMLKDHGASIGEIAEALKITDEQVIERYHDIVGRPHIVTEKTKREAIYLLALGCNTFEIARHFKIPESTFRRLYYEEWRLGKNELKLRTFGALVEGATGERWSEEKQRYVRTKRGPNARLVIAINKSLGNISETVDVEISGKDGGPIQTQATVIHAALEQLREARAVMLPNGPEYRLLTPGTAPADAGERPEGVAVPVPAGGNQGA